MTVLHSRSSGEPYLVERNAGYFEYQLPVSLKAVISWNGRLPLLRNERDEWELPGGKLDPGEEPAVGLAREIREELAWDATVGEPFHTWVYRVFPHRHVLVVTFLATYDGDVVPVYSHEHKELVLVTPDEAGALDMPEGYKAAIRLAVERGHFRQD
ncbi:NUDIX hydrolase [Promicromonospora iranensis]|uniref:8-oxo-dGTP pyrophosphatase MutT (NUDIX family) n=1 Tax=Promicromonospora iranensis TaxID=1105144 RepID=A0ABU2CHY1_9MICO|nr:NUDIX domain-containing protein [Promicromonospora iranensis]MDR7380951.1 8-oxo-dGTP pyrophosphatase MutT (NUDIX family) [Promicromonospora iranensis]